MSAYICTRCGDLKESQDGCEKAPSPPYRPYQLLCQPCADEYAEEAVRDPSEDPG